MDYQITSEISSFWNTLCLPIFFGILTIVFLSWILGGEIQYKIWKKLFNGNKEKYVMRNGIYIPRDITQLELIKNKIMVWIREKTVSPIILVFIAILLMFGFYQIVLLFFQPMLVQTTYAMLGCGINDYLLADLWANFPDFDINDLYLYIIQTCDEYYVPIVLYAIEAYGRLYIYISIILFISSVFWKSKSEKKYVRKRILKIIPLICLIIGVNYFVQIQCNNQIIRNKCYSVYNELRVQNAAEFYHNDSYLSGIEYDREKHEDSLFYDGYVIRFPLFEALEYMVNSVSNLIK